jgi:XTP/dITP diphosphohydrolase
MKRRLSPSEPLVIATSNAGKLGEFASLLAPYAHRVIPAGKLGLAEPEETGLSFTDNALIKARAAARAGHIALADDSGLCVTALKGEPGIYSARWAEPKKDFTLAMKRVHDQLADAADRSAYFACVLALAWPDGHTETFEGHCDGQITWPPRGDKGHGYDPIFIPAGETRTFAEMHDAEKNTLSHRGIAMRKLIEFLITGN